MGPTSAKSYPGTQIVRERVARATEERAVRAQQEIDYGRRGKGYIYGALLPATGEAFTQPYARRRTVHWMAFLEQVEAWLPPETERVYAILDNVQRHRAPDVLLFSLAHPRWEFVFQPKYAAGLERAERLRQAILKRAFEGRLAPQDPNDEPASVLLARIRAERAVAAANGAGRARKSGVRRGRKEAPQPAFDLDGTGPMCEDRGEAVGGDW